MYEMSSFSLQTILLKNQWSEALKRMNYQLLRSSLNAQAAIVLLDTILFVNLQTSASRESRIAEVGAQLVCVLGENRCQTDEKKNCAQILM